MQYFRLAIVLLFGVIPALVLSVFAGLGLIMAALSVFSKDAAIVLAITAVSLIGLVGSFSICDAATGVTEKWQRFGLLAGIVAASTFALLEFSTARVSPRVEPSYWVLSPIVVAAYLLLESFAGRSEVVARADRTLRVSMTNRNYRIYWIVSIGIIAISCIYFGQQYSKLRSVEHHLPLVAILIAPDADRLSMWVVEYELQRRVRNGDFRGSDVLSDVLAIGSYRDDLRPTAFRRAEWLVEELVDVNSEMSGGYPPLFGAIIGNEPLVAEQLIRLGADPAVEAVVGSPNDEGVDAIEYARMVSALFPDRDMTVIFALLNIESSPD